MFQLPTMENVAQVIVDETVVKSNKEPLISYAKDKKTSAA
jgi:ATP-dependent protease Clp ATPase subunit